jgi:hypothetical protein
MNQVTKLKLFLGIFCTGIFLGGGMVINDIWSEVIRLQNPQLFENFNPKPIEVNTLSDENGTDYTEPVFSEEDQAIIDEQNRLLEEKENYYVYF